MSSVLLYCAKKQGARHVSDIYTNLLRYPAMCARGGTCLGEFLWQEVSLKSGHTASGMLKGCKGPGPQPWDKKQKVRGSWCHLAPRTHHCCGPSVYCSVRQTKIRKSNRTLQRARPGRAKWQRARVHYQHRPSSTSGNFICLSPD